MNLTLIVPFYRNVKMLERQVQEWNLYPPGLEVVCIDDGSPEPAAPILDEGLAAGMRNHVRLYRIDVDIPWNRGGARNLGANKAATDWIVQVDIDHVLPADAAAKLLELEPDPGRWYRFPRWRRGQADETRLKDAIPPDQHYGEIHPHVDSYLVRREIYWQAGGYDEAFSGSLGGGNPFLAHLERVQPVAILKAPIRMEVYTRSEIEDASDWSLSRDKSRYSERRRELKRLGNPRPKDSIKFPWSEIRL
jgi:glycosyltransferase involved in cell wall biosynthesis